MLQFQLVSKTDFLKTQFPKDQIKIVVDCKAVPKKTIGHPDIFNDNSKPFNI